MEIDIKVGGKRKRSKFIQVNNNGDLFCYHCHIFKSEDNFGINNANILRKNKDKNCKSCRTTLNNLRKERNRGKRDLNRLLLERWHGCKLRDKNKILDFTWEYLRELWDEQKGRCAISDIEMTYLMSNGRTPTNVSVDKIDGKLGYRKGNIQLLCMAVNQMKSDLNLQELIFFCNKIITNNDNSYKKEKSWEVHSFC